MQQEAVLGNVLEQGGAGIKAAAASSQGNGRTELCNLATVKSTTLLLQLVPPAVI